MTWIKIRPHVLLSMICRECLSKLSKAINDRVDLELCEDCLKKIEREDSCKMKFTEAQIRSDMLFALKRVKAALDNGLIIGDPKKTLEDISGFVNLVNVVTLAIWRAEEKADE